MKNKQYHEIIVRIDEDRKAVVGVLLASTCKTCWLYAEDYEAIIANYELASWVLNSAGEGKPAYVRFKHQGKLITVARLILDAPARTAVKHKDKNTLNLRQSNLWLDHGGGGVRKKPKTSKKPKFQPLGSGLHIPVRASND
ncbi:hypothetical protein AA309_07415 [Microvirga vignae]|uniref:Uncharacterized protein n=1 Tax=Microvirga vignae TaxID=1225564 RepID=A0A0H1REP4_9HYPH|nr:hypothetical protein AA309_07415 [Microvirga vignae]